MKQSFLLLMCLLCIAACAPTNEADCLECRNWKLIQVKEDGLVVYAEGAVNLYPAYSNFRFNLIHDNRKVEYRDIIGEQFTGNWGINDDKSRLMLNNLSPLLYGTESSLAFDIVSISATSLVLRNTTVNPKTGNTVNEYTLVPR